jgi:hypothetical protein
MFPKGNFSPVWVQDSPGLAISFVLLAAASVYLLVKKRPGLFDADLIACLIVVGFVVVVLASPSKSESVSLSSDCGPSISDVDTRL